MITFILAVACLLLGARLLGRKLKHQEEARRQTPAYREVRDAVLTQRGLARMTEGAR